MDLAKIAGAVFILFLAFLVEGVRELGFFKVTRYTVCVPKFKQLDGEKRIILLTDLHNKVYGRKNKKLLEAVRRAKPDIILIGGDMLVAKETPAFQAAMDFVTMLPQICSVYYGLGNHEQRMKENPWKYGSKVYSFYKKRLVRAGVEFLENGQAEFMLDRLHVQLHGLELPLETYKKFKKHSVTGEDVRRCIGRAETRKYQILLAHNPSFFAAYKEWGADLTVSGHLHGGSIRIPGMGGIITPQMKLFPKYSGELTVEGEQAIVVSKGLGTHTINFRFCNCAELVVIRLKPYAATFRSRALSE